MELTDSALFNGISKENIYKMIGCFNAGIKKFKTGETICDFTYGSSDIAIIEKGKAALFRIDINGGRTMLGELDTGAIFGNTISFSNTGGDSIFVECTEDSEVLFLPCQSITTPCCNSCEHHSQLLKNLFYIMSAQMLNISRRVEILSNRSIRDKLMCCFNIYASDAGSRRFKLPLSMSALAEYICSDRSAMMREIKNMKDEGLIEINKKNITIL